MLFFPSLSSPVAFALPAAVSPAAVGVVVGAVLGVIAFMVVVLVASRRGRRRQVVTIPPYATGISRITPMPIPPQIDEEPLVFQPRPKFVPTTQLSASALARMGIPVGPFGEKIPEAICEDDDVVEVDLVEGEDGNFRLPVSVAPVVVLESNRVAHESGLHPLAVIPSSSRAMVKTPPSGVQPVAAASSSSSGTMMRAAPIADLAFDDAATEIAETFFDEPPKPRMRSEPPRIRKKSPEPPRFQRRS